MAISDQAAAHACLERIGYYRLSGYWYPFRKSHVSVNAVTGAILPHPQTGRAQVIVEDDFRSGTAFQSVMDLYVFDKRLRLLFLDALERIEVALRVDIALLLGARDPWAHRHPNQVHGRFSKVVDPKTGESEYQKWLDRLDKTFNRSKDEFAKHFKQKYRGEFPPIWIAIELWDFGMLSIFLGGMKHADQAQLATKYGMARPELLTSWVRNLNHIRNICAHHSRLWNRSPADQVSPPRPGENTLLDHLATNRFAITRVYASAVALQYLLRSVNPASSWGSRLKAHCATFPPGTALSLGNAGFPSEWQDLDLWR
jgi:abortive infection bacteriophage resistance protein